MKSQKMKTIFVIACLIIIFFCMKSIFTPSKKENPAVTSETAEAVTSEVQTEEATTIEPEVETETEPESEVVEHRTGDTVVGVSNQDIEDLDPVFFKSVINDVTGNWRYATISSNVDIENYVLSYYKNYFKADNEVHGIVNFARNTTTRLNYSNGIIMVSIMDYVDGEEHDAKLMYSGQLLATYYVYTDNGDIEELKN